METEKKRMGKYPQRKNHLCTGAYPARAVLLAVIAAAALLLGIGVGSVQIPLEEIGISLKSFLLGEPLGEEISGITYGMVTGIRLPRVLTAFLAGAALSVSGAVMQSTLKNPLASSYGLGVSAGAGLGATLLMVGGLSLGGWGSFLLPAVGTAFGFLAVVAAMGFAARVDRNLSNHTIILSGMALSLFLTAVINTISAANPQYSNQILLWQLGTFSGKGWDSIALLGAALLVCLFLFWRRRRELDIMTFGEEQALAIGVELKKEKWVMIILTSLLTGTAVSYVGIIGFVDLIAPHVVRRFFGSSHGWVLPMSALFGGAFMVACDLVGRTITAPNEISVGSITALVGTPFFLYMYFIKSGSKGHALRG